MTDVSNVARCTDDKLSEFHLLHYVADNWLVVAVDMHGKQHTGGVQMTQHAVTSVPKLPNDEDDNEDDDDDSDDRN